MPKPSTAGELRVWARRRRNLNESRAVLAATQRFDAARRTGAPGAWSRFASDLRDAVGDDRAKVILWKALVSQVGEEGAREIVAKMREQGDDTAPGR